LRTKDLGDELESFKKVENFGFAPALFKLFELKYSLQCFEIF